MTGRAVKKLILLRHAKSGWDDPVERDFDRPLNAKGHRAAATVGRHLRALHLHFDAVFASPAVRVKETLGSMEKGFGQPLDPHFDQRIYLASAETLLDVIHDVPDSAETLLLVGHNPGLEDLVLLLVPDRDEDIERDKVEEKYPTASIAEIAFDVAGWREVTAGGGKLCRFVRPRDLDPALGPGH
jgi:phosphohistidine phosphatase